MPIIYYHGFQIPILKSFNRPPPFQNQPANFPLVGAGPKICPQNSFWRHRYVSKARNELYNFEISGFPDFLDPESGFFQITDETISGQT